jgi:hypothetical protein
MNVVQSNQVSRVCAITNKRKEKRSDPGTMVSILSASYAKVQLQTILGVLNSSMATVPRKLDGENWDWQTIDTTETQLELRRLIAEWDKSGPNLQQLFKQNPDLQERCSRGTMLLIPTKEGRAQLAWTPHQTVNKSSPQKAAALTHFIQFLVNPLALELGGPCMRCDKFYVKNTTRQKTYCSRRCGTGRTALSATQRRREAEYAKKLLMAQQKIEQYVASRTRAGWKEWVGAKTKGEITEKWLTRAVNSGKLIPPAR